MKRIIPILIFIFSIGLNSYSQKVDLQKGLVAYYPFNGNANDESSNGNNGTVYGASLTSDRNGKANSAYYFSGNKNEIVLSKTIQFDNREFTISGWIYIDSNTDKYSQIWMSGYNGGNQDIEIVYNSKKEFVFYVRDVTKKISSCRASSLNLHEWFNFQAIKTNHKLKLYIDGELVNETSHSLADVDAIDVIPVIGNGLKNTNNRWFNGRLDDFRIYSRALNKAEIQALYTGNTKSDKKPPRITITKPDVSRGFKIVEQKQITVAGKVTDESGIYEVLINGQDATVDAYGNFSKNVFLAVGENTFTVQATDIKQNSKIETFLIKRQSKTEEVIVNNNTNNLSTGKYYALVIGVSNYPDPNIPNLGNEPINDAKELSRILSTYYTFNSNNIITLQNPTYKLIIRTFDDLSNKITANDNLLLFYAGHGYFDEKTETGYWLASDAEYKYTDAWLYNSTLVDIINKIHSKHTLLISDACFSGSIFKTRALPSNAGTAYQKKYELKSRNAITSGTLKTVSNKSIFFKYLSDRLINNKKPYFSASELFQAIDVISNL